MRVLILLCVLANLLPLARAEPPTDQSIEQLLFVTRAQETVDSMLTMVRASMKRISASMPGSASEEKRKALDAIETRATEMIASELAWDKMKPMFVETYREVFTQAEIDGLIAFYQSPAGIAYVEKMPLVAQKTMQIMQQRMAPLVSKLAAASDELKAQTKAAK